MYIYCVCKFFLLSLRNKSKTDREGSCPLDKGKQLAFPFFYFQLQNTKNNCNYGKKNKHQHFY